MRIDRSKGSGGVSPPSTQRRKHGVFHRRTSKPLEQNDEFLSPLLFPLDSECPECPCCPFCPYCPWKICSWIFYNPLPTGTDRAERGLPNPPLVPGFTGRFGRPRSARPIRHLGQYQWLFHFFNPLCQIMIKHFSPYSYAPTRWTVLPSR